MQLMALLAAIACLPPVAVATEGNAFERVFPNEYRDILRRASLAYGVVENDGIRCQYHGWKFDASGRCVEQPFEDTTHP